MAHETSNGIDESKAVAYHSPAANAPAERVDSVLRRAERLVRDLAPPPEPLDDQYRPAAADTELAVFEHLFEHPSYMERDVMSDANTVYRDQGAVEELIRQSMGSYYVGPREIPPKNDPPRPRSRLTNVSPDPLW